MDPLLGVALVCIPPGKSLSNNHWCFFNIVNFVTLFIFYRNGKVLSKMKMHSKLKLTLIIMASPGCFSCCGSRGCSCCSSRRNILRIAPRPEVWPLLVVTSSTRSWLGWSWSISCFPLTGSWPWRGRGGWWIIQPRSLRLTSSTIGSSRLKLKTIISLLEKN